MSEKTLKFNNIKVNKKEFHKFKQAIELDLVDTGKIVVSEKVLNTLLAIKKIMYYIKSLCIILPQMNSYIKYFDNSGKNMSFLIKNSEVWEKYEDIWDVLKNKLGIKFHSKPTYKNKYLKTKVREFYGSIKTNFLGNNLPKENAHYTCIACITLNSILKMNKKNYPQIYLEECKYKVKKIRTSIFTNIELESDSEPELETDFESNTAIEN